jgi:hypothetical protein
VVKRGKRFQAKITIDRKLKSLGTYATAKEAALAFDRAVVQHKRPSSKLNFPDGLPIDDEDYEEIMNPKKKRKLSSANTTGYNGVYKNKKRFQAQIRVDGGKRKHLGTHDTPKEAALAYDRAVIQHKLSSSKLNFPNDYTTSSEDNKSSEEESDDSSSSSSDSCHSSDDDDESNDEKDAVEPPPSPVAQPKPQFEREPMLDQLFADAQSKKQEQQQQQQQQQQHQVEVEEVEEEKDSDPDSFWL